MSLPLLTSSLASWMLRAAVAEFVSYVVQELSHVSHCLQLLSSCSTRTVHSVAYSSVQILLLRHLTWHAIVVCNLVFTQARTSSLVSLAAMAELVAECVSAVDATWDRKRCSPLIQLLSSCSTRTGQLHDDTTAAASHQACNRGLPSFLPPPHPHRIRT